MNTEIDIEHGKISKLEGRNYSCRPALRDHASLEENFREKFEALNRVALAEG